MRPRRLQDCIPLLEGWRRLAEEVDFPVYIETHRDRMTTDLYFTLDLLDCFPDLKLLADLSHFLVGREFATPVDETNHAYMRRILDNSWAFHGRVASREQVQIEISFPASQDVGRPLQGLVGVRLPELAEARRRGRRRSPSPASWGRSPMRSPGRDGNDTTDRWEESLQMAEIARRLWAASA